MKLRIGIDGRVFVGNKAGIGHYVSELCKALDKVLTDVEFYVYSRDQVKLPVSGSNWMLRTESSLLKKKIPNILWLKFISGFLCRKDRIDVYWGTGSLLPFFLGPVHTILTIYDMVYRIVPETMYKFNLCAFRMFFEKDARKAKKITTISRGTSERLKTLLGLDSDAVIYPSVNERFVPQREEEVRQCLKKYGIIKPYFLSVATWEPRKNLHLLLETFLRMKENGELDNYGLLLVGGHGWKNEQLISILGENYQSKDILFLGYVADEVLPLLYSGAKAFLFPSIYEGFGMPVLEARKCGTQVITSDIPELREAGGNGCIYINPTGSGIRDGILRLLDGQVGADHDNVSNPTWDEGAKKLARIFMDVAF